jgi:tetratricopeptide (TPR) repeat protein
MRECFDANMLLRYLDRELSDADAREVETHVQACGRCEETLALLADGAGPGHGWQVDALETPVVQSAEAGPGEGDTTCERAVGGSSGSGPIAGGEPARWHDADTARVVALLEEGGRFQVLGEVGRGGMGWVLRGRDLRLGRDLAFKVLRPEYRGNPEVERRFVLEARVCSQLQHPGIVPVYEAGRLSDGQPYFAMKLIEGQTLTRLLAARSSPAEGLGRWLGVFVQVCQAVARAHSRGVLHRDLKPGNVMIGEFDEVQVMDWGMAKVRDLAAGPVPAKAETEVGEDPAGSDPAEATRAGTRMGTLAYMAPEQARGEVGRLDARCDVFGLGAILCEILTGRPPYQGKGLVEKACAGELGDAWARLDGCGADPELVGLARRCLAVEPSGRPADAGAVAAEVGAYLAGAQERLRTAELERAAAEARAEEARAKVVAERRARRRSVQLVLAGALLAALVGGGGWWVRQQADQREAERAKILQEFDEWEPNALSLQEAGRFREAEAVVQRLEGLIQTGVGGPDLPDRVARLRTHLVLVADFQRARLENARLSDDRRSYGSRQGALLFREAFRRYGIDVLTPSPDEAAAAVQASPIREALLGALVDWAVWTPDRGEQERLPQVVELAAPAAGEFGRRWRDLVKKKDSAGLARLAGEGGAADLPAALVVRFSRDLDLLGAPAEAVSLLRAAQQRQPGDFWLNVELAFRLGRAGPAEQGEAVRFWTAAVALRPQSPGTHLNLGASLKNQKDPVGAIREYREALRLEPDYAVAHYNLGVVFSEQNDLAGAIREFREAVRLDPEYAKAYTSLGSALRDKGELEEALGYFRKAVELDERLALAHTNLGSALRDKGQGDEALKYLCKAVELDPGFALAHYNLGSALEARGQGDKAIQCYREALALDPQLAPAHNNLGAALHRRGQLDEALACYRRALALDPGIALAHYNLGTALGTRGHLEEAIVCLSRALALDPRYAPAHGNLGDALAARGRLDEAIECYRKALAHDPGYANAHVALGLALLRQGRYAEARESSAQAARLLPDKHPLRSTVLRQLQGCERLLELEKRLPRLLRGEDKPNSAAECLDFARVCRDQQRYAAASRFSAEAFARQPPLADDLARAHRYNAGCAAALTAAGRDRDADTVGPADRLALRRQALTWLRADLHAWSRLAEGGTPQARAAAARALAWWLEDPDLAGLRDESALANLPAAERDACRQLWADVAALLRRVSQAAKR